MGLYNPSSPCYFCGKPLGDGDLIGFDFLEVEDCKFRPLDDGVVHLNCLSEWKLRDELVAYWNDALSQNQFLKDRKKLFVDEHGMVRIWYAYEME